jgi:hypothetical protein
MILYKLKPSRDTRHDIFFLCAVRVKYSQYTIYVQHMYICLEKLEHSVLTSKVRYHTVHTHFKVFQNKEILNTLKCQDASARHTKHD